MRSKYLSFCPTMFSSPVEKERAQVLFVFVFLRVVFRVSSLFFFRRVFDNIPLRVAFPL